MPLKIRVPDGVLDAERQEEPWLEIIEHRLAGDFLHDGRLPDLKKPYPKELIPLVSKSWNSHFKWRGQGPLPEEESEKLRQILAETHAQGRKFRFWGTPDRAEFWAVLSKAGVDLLNADDLAGLRRFLVGAGAR